MNAALATLFGGGLIGGPLMQAEAQGQVRDARLATVGAERGRQAAYDAETSKLNDQALGRYSNFDTQMADKAKQLSDMFKTPVTTPNTPYTVAPLPPVSSDIVQREVDNKNGIANAYVNHQADTLGNLRSFGDLFADIGAGQARDASSIGQIGGFKKGSAGVTQLELDAASHAGDEKKAWADMINGLSKVGMTAMLSGSFAPAAAAPAASAVASPSIFSQGTTPFLTYGR